MSNVRVRIGVKAVVGVMVAVLVVVAAAHHRKLISAAHTLSGIANARPFEVAFILICLKAVSAPLGVPGTPLTLLAGTLLGNVFGTVTALVGNTIGTTFGFCLRVTSCATWYGSGL